VLPAKPSLADQWDAKAKLAVVIKTAGLNEIERSEHCREHGLSVFFKRVVRFLCSKCSDPLNICSGNN